MLEVKAQLPRAELEPWDRGWSRLYETLPASQLDEGVLEDAASRMAGYIVTLQPLLDNLKRINAWIHSRRGTSFHWSITTST